MIKWTSMSCTERKRLNTRKHKSNQLSLECSSIRNANQFTSVPQWHEQCTSVRLSTSVHITICIEKIKQNGSSESIGTVVIFCVYELQVLSIRTFCILYLNCTLMVLMKFRGAGQLFGMVPPGSSK